MGVVTTSKKSHLGLPLDPSRQRSWLKYTNRKEFCMNFKKYSEMELAMLASIATMTEYTAHRIARENGDLTPVVDEDCISAPEFSYLNKPNAVRPAIRRKETFKKKAEQKTLAQSLGYDLSSEDNSKKVRDLLSSNHSDNAYFKGYKAEKKYMSIKEETNLMEQEEMEKAREAMLGEHKAALSAISDSIASMNSELESYDSTIEAWENDYKELEELLELLSEKLNDAKLKRNGVKKAISQKVIEKDILEEVQRRERISKFGW